MKKNVLSALVLGALVIVTPLNAYVTHSQKHALKGICYASILPIVWGVASEPITGCFEDAVKYKNPLSIAVSALVGTGLLWAALSSYNSFYSAVMDTDVVEDCESSNSKG